MMNRAFLIICPVDLVPIALGCGAMPAATLGPVFGIEAETANLANIMRAVMGLQLGMAALWLWGALRPSMEGPVLIACAAFMLGIAPGRMLGLALDGLPHWLLVVQAVLEVAIGLAAVSLCRRSHSAGSTAFRRQALTPLAASRPAGMPNVRTP